MLGTVKIESLLSCPVCGNDLDVDLKCMFCNREFSTREGVFILIDRETSGMEWRWDRRILSQKYRQDVLRGYERLISPEVRKARELWWKRTIPLISALQGTVLDLATGLGMMLEKLLTLTDTTVIATDIDPNVLLSTKRDNEMRSLRKAVYVASDAKHLALKGSSVDHVTSFAGINNIIDPDEVVSELYRVLRPGGTGIIMASFVNEDTPSAELAEDYGFLDAYIHEKFTGMIVDSGLTILEDVGASRVIWKENEMDVFPMGGDMVYYHTIEVQK